MPGEIEKIPGKNKKEGMIRKTWNILRFVAVMTVYFSYIGVGCLAIFLLRLVLPGPVVDNSLARAAKVLWLNLTKTVLSRYFPQKVFVRYDPRILSKSRNIVVSNHLTEYDWFFVSSVLHHFARFEDICIILKMTLRDIPLLGYGMQFFQFIFLNRKINRDIELIKSGISRLMKKGKYDLLIFPEGTYIDHESHPKSQAWSSEAKIAVGGRRFNPDEVIIPRTTGFKILTESMCNSIDGVLDITMVGNPHARFLNDVFSYWEVLINRSRNLNFMFFIDYIPRSDRLNSNEFLFELFERKEKMISRCREMRGENAVCSMCEFQIVADRICRSDIEYKDAVVDMTSPWGPLFYIVFLLGTVLVVGALSRMVFK